MSDKNPGQRKEAAIAFLTLASAGKVQDAFARYASPTTVHHNVYFKGDAATLMAGMEENAKKNPQKVFEVKRALEDGDLVATHSWVRQNATDRGAAVVHIFRFEGDRIVEMWDVGQPIPAESPNLNGPF